MDVDVVNRSSRAVLSVPHHGGFRSFAGAINDALTNREDRESGRRAVDLGLEPLSARQLARVESAASAWSVGVDTDFVVVCNGLNSNYAVYEPACLGEDPAYFDGMSANDPWNNSRWIAAPTATIAYGYQPVVVNDLMSAPWFQDCYRWLMQARARGVSTGEMREAVARRLRALQSRRPRANRRLVRWTLSPLRRLLDSLAPHAPPAGRRPPIVAEEMLG